MALWRCLGTMFWMERHQYCGAVVQMSVTVNNSKIEFDNNAFVGNLYNRQQRNVHRSICKMSRFLPILTNFGSTYFQIWRILSQWETHWYVRKDGRVDGRTERGTNGHDKPNGRLSGFKQTRLKPAPTVNRTWIFHPVSHQYMDKAILTVCHLIYVKIEDRRNVPNTCLGIPNQQQMALGAAIPVLRICWPLLYYLWRFVYHTLQIL